MTPQLVYMSVITLLILATVWLAFAMYYDWDKIQKFICYFLAISSGLILLSSFIYGWLSVLGLLN